MGLKQAPREKKLPMVIFLIIVHKNVYRRDQNLPIRGFREKGIFLTFPHEKTTFLWSIVVSKAIFPTN